MPRGSGQALLAPPLGTKGDLKLLAEEQVLDDEAPTAAESGDEGGLCEPDEFEHRGWIADQLSADRRAGLFAPIQQSRNAGSAPSACRARPDPADSWQTSR